MAYRLQYGLVMNTTKRFESVVAKWSDRVLAYELSKHEWDYKMCAPSAALAADIEIMRQEVARRSK